MAFSKERFNWQSENIQMFPVIRKDLQPMSDREISIYRSSCNTLCGLVLSGLTFLDVLKTLIIFPIMLDLEHGFPFIDAKTDNMWADLRESNFLAGASLGSCNRHIRISETLLWCPESLKLVQVETLNVIGIAHRDDKMLATSRNADKMLLVRAAPHHLTNPDGPKGIWLIKHFKNLEGTS